MNLLDLYTSEIANWINGGGLINRDKISAIGIKPLYDRILTKKYIRKAFIVTSLPVEFNISLCQMVRVEMFKAFPDVKVIIHSCNKPVNVPVTSENYKRQMANSASHYQEYSRAISSLRADEQLTGKTVHLGGGKKIHIRPRELKRMKDKYKSYEYVFKHKTNGGTFNLTRIFIEVLSPNRKLMRKSTEKIIDILRANQIYYKEVKGNVSTYLENFGVASFTHGNVKKFPEMLASDENLLTAVNYKTRGLINPTGIPLGLDWRTKLPFMLNFFESSAGQISLILGKTGSGKTYTAFDVALYLLNDKVHCGVIDIKGDEWNRLLSYSKGLEVSMEGRRSRFVNTLRLDDIECDKEFGIEFFQSAVKGTVQLLSIMTNLSEREGNPVDLEFLLDSAVKKLYASRGVYCDVPESFKNTSDIKLSDILPFIVEVSQASSLTPKQKEIASLARVRCSMYLQSEGGFADAFKNEITLGEILDSPLVIYSFNKNSGTVLDTLDTLRVFMVQFLDSKKQSVRKMKGLHTAAFYEELQRCDQFGQLLTYISHAVTGSRSSNVIIFLLMNALGALEGDSTKAVKTAMSSIKSNITTMILGKLFDGDIRTLVEDFGCQDIEESLKKVTQDREFEHCFVAKYDTGKRRGDTIFKTYLPDDMMEAFRTRDKKD